MREVECADDYYNDPDEVTSYIGGVMVVPVCAAELAARKIITWGEYGIYTTLWSFADRGGKCYPKQATIARRTGQSARTVENVLRKFRKIGLISAKLRYRPSGAKAGCIYYLHDPRVLLRGPSSPKAPSSAKEGGHPPQPRRVNRTNQEENLDTSPNAVCPGSPMDLQCSSVEVSPGVPLVSGCSIEDQRKPETPEPRRPVAPPAAAPEPPQDRPSGPRTPEPVPAHQGPPVSPPDGNLAPDKNHQAVRKALTRINTEYPFPIGYDELVTELVRIGRGDPWAGYLAAKPAWERPLTDDVRDPAAALRARLRNTPLVQATTPHADQTPAEHSAGRIVRGSQGGWAKCREQLRAAKNARRETAAPVPA